MPTPLPQPFEVTPGPVLQAMRMGQSDRLAEEQRGVLKQAGQLAAQGSLSGARKHLLGQGMLEEADKIGAMMRQADGDSLAKAKQTYDVLGNLAMTADTPEKWQMALSAASKAGMDVSKYGDFGNRDLVLAQSGKVGEHIENEMKRRELAIKEQAGAGNAFGELNKGERWRMKDGKPDLDVSGRPIAEPIPGSKNEQVSSETAARIGLADKFVADAPNIRKEIAAGKLSGADFQLGRGEAAAIYRRIEDGAEALVRNLTGAGMNKDEAEAYARRFLPGRLDRDETKLEKLKNLERNLAAVRQRVMTGRGIASVDEVAQPAPTQGGVPAANEDPLGILGP